MHLVLVRLYLCVAMCVAAPGLCAQILPFRNYSLQDGLPQSSIYSIAEDRYGFIWLASQAGISRFDGKNFHYYGIEEGMPDNTVNALLNDSKGRLWVASGGGLSRFDGKRFVTYTQKDGLPDNEIFTVFEDKQGNIWIGGFKGLSVLNGSTIQSFTSNEGFAGRLVYAIAQDSEGYIWLGTDRGLCRFDGHKFQVFGAAQGLQGDGISALVIEKDMIWCGTRGGGLALFDQKRFVHYTTANGLPSNFVTTLYKDRQQQLWVGTRAGLAHMSAGRFSVYTQANGLSADHITTLFEDRANNLWIGTSDGGVSVYSGAYFALYTKANGLHNEVVWSFAEDTRGNFYMATEEGLAMRSGSGFVPVPVQHPDLAGQISYVVGRQNGEIWVCTFGGRVARLHVGGLQMFGVAEGLPVSDLANCIYEDKQQRMWLGLDREGLFRFDGSRFVQYTTSDGLSSNRVMSLINDDKGNLWIGTREGICLYNGRSFINVSKQYTTAPRSVVYQAFVSKNKHAWFATDAGLYEFDGQTFRHYSKTFGFRSSLIWSIAEDASGHLWLGTADGLYRLHSETKQLRYFGHREGVRPIETNAAAAYTDKQGNVWIGTIGGALRYTPALHQTSKVAPLVYLSGITLKSAQRNTPLVADSTHPLLNVPVAKQAGADAISLSHDQNDISFEFIALHFRSPEYNLYQYQLQGYEKEWTAPTVRNVVDYTNLPAGQYTLLIKAANCDGVWTDEPFAFQFSILPAWYATWWVRTLLLLAFVGLVWVVIRWRSLRLEHDKQVLEREVQARTSEIQTKKDALELAYLSNQAQSQQLAATKDVLQVQNDQLTQTLEQLRTTQQHLVLSEKMAALGQLMNNVAHDINTPVGVIRAASAYLESLLPVIVDELPQFLQTASEAERQLFVVLMRHEQQFDLAQLSTREQRNIRSTLEAELAVAGRTDAVDVLSPLLQCGVSDTSSLRPYLQLPRLQEVVMQAARLRQVRNNLINISSSAERTRKVLHSLTAFTRERSQENTIKVDVQNSIEQVLNSYATYLKHRIRVFTQWDAKPIIKTDPDELSLVWTHLLYNAIQALSNVPQAQITIALRTDIEYLYVAIVDNGPGIPPEAMPHIFDAFYTTRAKGEGSGLGLYICKKIVENQGGTISVSSVLGRTSFVVQLPLAR